MRSLTSGRRIPPSPPGTTLTSKASSFPNDDGGNQLDMLIDWFRRRRLGRIARNNAASSQAIPADAEAQAWIREMESFDQF